MLGREVFKVAVKTLDSLVGETLEDAGLSTLLTVGASMVNLGPFNAPIAIGIAVTKAVFVVLFFMHVKYSSRLVKLTVAAGFFTFLILVFMSLLDYVSRAWGLW